MSEQDRAQESKTHRNIPENDREKLGRFPVNSRRIYGSSSIDHQDITGDKPGFMSAISRELLT
jgi:hypothetical protein